MNFFENEIMRRVKELDCSAVYREHNDEISVMYDGVKIAEISYETAEKISGNTDEESEKFLHIKRLCKNVSNYCAAYENGEPINIPNFSDGYRIIYQVGGAEMAARFDRKSGFEFVVWSDEEYPDFFVSYDKAREKFAILSGLVDREKIFDDEELEALYYCVYAVSEMCETLTEDMVKLLKNLEKKLDIAISKNLLAGKVEKYESAI